MIGRAVRVDDEQVHRVGPDVQGTEPHAVAEKVQLGNLPFGVKVGEELGYRDIALRVVGEGRDPNSVRVSDVMSTNVRTCREDDSVDDVMDVMGKEQVRRVPIVDERGSLVGIVAQADVVLQASSDKKAERTVEKISQPNR